MIASFHCLHGHLARVGQDVDGGVYALSKTIIIIYYNNCAGESQNDNGLLLLSKQVGVAIFAIWH